ncbi:N-acetyldiaminopimelate deacetylase [Mechercharimyces sp. CAU 1602]|uniref:N-acetyldiaminopimelate deacetylase n=1 Tax=Mechercharimyces sp. CAU 1602 TaxID=2973933 RepID=UPI0021613443|nr:N-acetyldiaminopimelate deacetylase [Mechercharimyces sp. CAU 1602]MCS1351888.1 N-acetyldiaminopimelate deacetylase [Mechercharimyces sp. CAU 1602]
MNLSPDPFIQIRRDLHQIPEGGFKEVKTQTYLLRYLATLPQERIEVKTWRTGILVRVHGTAPTRCLAYRADMDGLPIAEETDYSFTSQHPGYMHACGHDMHMAISLGILTYFTHHPIADDLLFIFQPAEEGPGGAEPMLASKEWQTWKPDLIFALHIAPELPVGSIATCPGTFFANTSELFIDLVGTSGHAARPHQANDMVIASSQLALQLQSIISRNVDPQEAAVLTIGKMEAGTKQNIIAGSARLEGTIRALQMDTMKRVKSRIRELVSGIELAYQCEATIDWGSNYCQVYNDEHLTRSFMEWAQASQLVHVVHSPPAMTGEDFGYFVREIPGFMFWLGVDTPYGLHHAKLQPDEDAIGIAIHLMTSYLTSLGE